jgi:bacterioferritin (cytochrome b1)
MPKTTIQVEKTTLENLKFARITKRESYDGIINRLLRKEKNYYEEIIARLQTQLQKK